MFKEKDISGMKFKMLTALHRVPAPKHITSHDKNYWLFRCECGREKIIRKADVVSGCFFYSCGCKPRKINQPLRATKFYKTYYRMRERCENKNSPKFDIYGGRGIKCEWGTFESFFADMYDTFLRHNKKYGGRNTSIDRIDVNGNYSKENCRWATLVEQARNKRCRVAT